MEHFLNRIRKKGKDPAQPPVLIVAYGDSVTQGVTEHRYLDGRNVYHGLLQRKLEAMFPATTFSTINAGVAGETASQALERLERDVLRHDPDLVLMGFGLNDALSGFEKLEFFKEALREIISRIRRNTSADIILLTPPMMASRSNFRIHPEHEGLAEAIMETQNGGVLKKYVEAIRRIASEQQAGLADIYGEWERLAEEGLDMNLWLINGLNHPDERGHQLAASLVLELISKARQKKYCTYAAFQHGVGALIILCIATLQPAADFFL